MKVSECRIGDVITNGTWILKRFSDTHFMQFGTNSEVHIHNLDDCDWQLLTPYNSRTLGKRVELDELEPCTNYAVRIRRSWCVGATSELGCLVWPANSIPSGYGSAGSPEDRKHIIAIYELGDYALPENPNVPEVEKSLREKVQEAVICCLKEHVMLDRTIPSEVDRTVDSIIALLESEARNE